MIPAEICKFLIVFTLLQKQQNMKSPTLKTFLYCGLLLLAMMTANALTFAQSNDLPANDLPELGDSATQYLNPAQEKQIGQAFLRQLIRNPSYVEDYPLQDYLQSVGDRVGASANLRGGTLSFNLLKNNALNAFAVPGGYITFNTGLIMTTKTESQLASVVGHEIAHLSQRHLPRLLAKAHENKFPLIAAVIGSILVGGQTGLAGLTAANAAAASSQLSYTRGFEREADAIGIRLLARARYDPNAMAEFFSELERHARHDSAQTPAFLRTHPLSFTRIAESEARARKYPPQDYASSFEFYLAKARIRALYTERRDDPMAFFQEQMESEQTEIKGAAMGRSCASCARDIHTIHGNNGGGRATQDAKADAAIYGAALALTQSRKLAQARTLLTPLSERYPAHPWIQAALAEIDLADNKVEQAIVRYRTLISNNPNKVYLTYYLADAFLLNRQPHLAKKTVRYQIRRHPDLYRLYRFLSRANAQQGSLAEAHQADADYHAVLGNYAAAIASLKLALRESEPEGYLAQSIAARLSDLQEKLALQKKIGKG